VRCEGKKKSAKILSLARKTKIYLPQRHRGTEKKNNGSGSTMPEGVVKIPKPRHLLPRMTSPAGGAATLSKAPVALGGDGLAASPVKKAEG
jgi:hypothetical protein